MLISANVGIAIVRAIICRWTNGTIGWQSVMEEYKEARAKSQEHRPPAYPADHQVGMKVPKGGSDCAKCEYVRANGKECANKGFVMWNGSHELPEPANEYCCDFFEAK